MPAIIFPFVAGLVVGGVGAATFSDDVRTAAKWLVIGGVAYLIAKDRGVV